MKKLYKDKTKKKPTSCNANIFYVAQCKKTGAPVMSCLGEKKHISGQNTLSFSKITCKHV